MSLAFISLSFQAFRLLPANQRTKLNKHFLFAILLAGLEVLSLAFIFPMLQFLIVGSKSQPNSFILRNLNLYDEPLNWVTILIVIVCLYVFKNVFAVWQMHSQARFLDQLYVSFADKIYQQFYRKSWNQYTRENSAESFRKIKNTAYEFTHNVLASFLLLLPEALICFLMTAVIIWIDYRIMFILFLLFLPILIFYMIFQKKVIQKIDKSFRELTPQSNIVLSQGIQSFAEARIYAKEKYFIQHFIDISKITTRLLSKLKTFINIPSRLVETIGIICFSGIVAYGKAFPEYQQSLLAFLVMVTLVIYRIIPSINKIIINLSQIQAYAYVVTELKDILQETSNQVPHSKEISFNQQVEIKSVSFKYDNKSSAYLLKDLSITIRKGDFIVLEGPSGTGKTSFMHLIAGLISEYEGKIFIDETLLTAETLAAWQAKLGLVPQAPIILQDSVLHNIGFGINESEIDIEKVNEALRLAKLFDLVDSFELKLNTPIGENGLTLSGGQRQRLALARALYRSPEVILLDEVTNHLDDRSKSEVLTSLQFLCQEKKATIFLATHDVSVRKYATRILRLTTTKIEECGLENFSKTV